MDFIRKTTDGHKLVDEKEELMVHNTQGLSYCMNFFRE